MGRDREGHCLALRLSPVAARVVWRSKVRRYQYLAARTASLKTRGVSGVTVRKRKRTLECPRAKQKRSTPSPSTNRNLTGLGYNLPGGLDDLQHHIHLHVVDSVDSTFINDTYHGVREKSSALCVGRMLVCLCQRVQNVCLAERRAFGPILW